jgi:hypothetical protein
MNLSIRTEVLALLEDMSHQGARRRFVVFFYAVANGYGRLCIAL